MRRRLLVLAVGLALVVAVRDVAAQSPTASNAPPASLIAAAKREGTVALYTSLAPSESQPLAQAFEAKYGIRVVLWRALSSEVVQRVVTEGRGRHDAVDVVETNGPEMEMIARERLLTPVASSHVADVPPASVPRHRNWVPDRLNFFVVGFNTAKVRRADLPTTIEGFADPRWKGRLALEATDAEWMATLVKLTPGDRGMETMRRLAATQPTLRKGHVLLASLVAAGDVPIGLAMYNGNIEALKRKGAPIDFIVAQPLVARPQGIGVAARAPHPNAAQLFADYVLSPEGQSLFLSLGRIPASTRVRHPFSTMHFTTIDPVTVIDEADKWERVWTGLFVRR
jgi:iron(III) transport system substrate-binding protein